MGFTHIEIFILLQLAWRPNEHQFIEKQQQLPTKHNRREYLGQQLNFHYQLEALCVFLWWRYVVVWSPLSLWVSGLKESQVSQCCSTVPSLFDEETSCKIDVNLKVMWSSFRACSDQPAQSTAANRAGPVDLVGLTVSSSWANWVVEFNMTELRLGPLLCLLHLSLSTPKKKQIFLWCVWLISKKAHHKVVSGYGNIERKIRQFAENVFPLILSWPHKVHQFL